MEMNFRCFAKSSQSETPSVPFPPENNLHNFRIATIIFSRTQMPYKRFLFGITFFSNQKKGGKNAREDEKKREWVHSESVTSLPIGIFQSIPIVWISQLRTRKRVL